MKKKKLGNIQKQYLITMLAVLVGMIAISIYTYASFYRNGVADVKNLAANVLAEERQEVEAYLEEGMRIISVTSMNLDQLIAADATDEELQAYLEEMSGYYEKNIDIHSTGLYGCLRGKYIDGAGWTPEEGFDATERGWYQQAIAAKGKVTLITPYLDVRTGNMMLSICQMLADGESVVSIDLKLGKLHEIASGIKLENHGFGFICDKNGVLVEYSNLSDENQLKQLAQEVHERSQSKFETVVDNRKCSVFVDKVLDEWNIVLVVDNNELFNTVRNIMARGIVAYIVIFGIILVFCTQAMLQSTRYSEKMRESQEQLASLNDRMMSILARTIDAKDKYTKGHSNRVALYSRELAKRMGKSEAEQRDIYNAALLHDIGKIRIPDSIINKAGKLTDEEFGMIKLHPVAGYHILKGISQDRMLAQSAKFHHERYDGRGYPNGLTGDNIPEYARIIGVADSYDAMASNRSYRDALPQEVVRSEIEKGMGTQFDPEIAKIMLQMIDEDKDYHMKQMDELKYRVLITDDDKLNHIMVTRILKNEPMYEFVHAYGGMEAISIMQREKIDLVLLDIEMPAMNGFETLEKIREKYDTPVIFMTGNRDLESINRATELGVEDYVTKPFLPAVLIEILHGVLS